MNIPFQETWLLDLGIVFFIIIIFLLIQFIIRRLLDIPRSESERRIKQEGCIGCYVKLILIIFLLLVSIAIISSAVLVQPFHTFTDKQMIAEITCEKIGAKEYAMQFTITQQFDDTPRNFDLRGEEWFIKGDLIIWKSWLSFWGLRNRYRLTMISGLFEGTPKEQRGKKTIYHLMEYERNRRWGWLFKLGAKLPLHEFVPIGISAPPANNKIFRLYINNQGFSVEAIDKGTD